MKQKNSHKTNLVLIGMPGAGKTTIGKLLADKLALTFCDTDDLLIDAYGMPLIKMIEAYGNEGFKARENDLCAHLDLTGNVIATGGSVVYGKESMAHLGAIGRVIYLRVSEETEERNLSNLSTRGVVMRPGETLHELYCERVPLYEKYADLTVDCDAKTAEEISAELAERLKTV